MDIGNDLLVVLRIALILIGVFLIFERFVYFRAKYRRWNALAKIRREEKDFSEKSKHIASNSRALEPFERWSLAQFGEVIPFLDFLIIIITLIVCGCIGFLFAKEFGLNLSRNFLLIFLSIASLFGFICGLFASITAFNDLKNYGRVIPFVVGIFYLIASLVGFYRLYQILVGSLIV